MRNWQQAVAQRCASTGDTRNGQQFASFLNFDVGALTAADVANPTFEAIFSIDYDSRLNSVNNGANVLVGQNVLGAWDTTGTSNPLYDWGWNDGDTNDDTPDPNAAQGVFAENTQLIVEGIAATDPLGQRISVDISDIIANWVNDPTTNQGLVLFQEFNQSNGAGFSDAQIVVSVAAVPEPSSLAILLMGGTFVASRRRRAC